MGKRKQVRLGVDPARLRQRRPAREKSLRIRVSQTEHDEMVSTAEAYGLTVSDYIRQLHQQATASLRQEGGGQ